MTVVLEETQLWLECSLGNHDRVVELLESGAADPKSDDSFGVQGQTPLHYACQHGWLDVVQSLITNFNCDATVEDRNRETPLQWAHTHGRKDIVRYLVVHLVTASPGGPSSAKRHDVSIIATTFTDLQSTYSANRQLDESTRTAIRKDLSLILKFLFELPADLFRSIQRSDQEKLLVFLCKYQQLRSIRKMVEQYGCDVKIQDDSQCTPLHYACRYGSLKVAQYLIRKGCDPGVTDVHKKSSLHHACKSSNVSLVECLIALNDCDPKQPDSNGNTALHIACESNSPEVVRYLLSEAKMSDFHTPNEHGQTPLELTTSMEIVKEFIRHGANPADVYKKHGKVLGTKHPLVPPVKVFVVGNPFAGKSTLAAALQSDALALFSVPFRSKKVTGVDERTAGVIPHDFKSKKYGRVTLYDLAGQREFYGSHSALLQNAIQSSAPVFLLVVDLYDSCKEIESNVLYWLAFIENQCTCVRGKPHVIVVGSHLDVLNHKGEDISPKEKVITQGASHHSTSIEFSGFVAMDCQYSGSNAMTKLHRCLKASCDSVRVVDCISFNAHCFLALLLDSFQKTAAIQIRDVRRIVTENERGKGSKLSEYVPVSPVALNNICAELNDRGHILFLKDESDIENSWIIIDKVALLSEVNGTIFAPEDFKQHCQLASSTGVVPHDRIVEQFPAHDHDMLIGFLSHLEFCHKLSDSEVLQLIGEEDQKRSCESYFLFPALIKLDAPGKVWERKSHFSYHSGWVLQCSKSKQFYTPRFFQVLLLRLAFSCAFPQTESEIDGEFPALQRKCSIWKNGICWGTRDGVEALVEVVDRNNALLFLTRSRELTPSCLRLRSVVIQKILKAAKEFCPKVETVEYFIAPEEVLEHPLRSQVTPVSTISEASSTFFNSMSKQEIYTRSVSDLTLFSISEVATALASEKTVALSKNGTPLSLDVLLSFEPYVYMGQAILHKVFADSESPTEIVPDNFLLDIADMHKRAVVAGLMKVTPTSGPTSANTSAVTSDADIIITAWKRECEGTYKCLRERLDSFSVFAGRNIMVSQRLYNNMSTIKLIVFSCHSRPCS